MSTTVRLLQEACAGDRFALDALYERHRGRLLAFVRAQMPAWLEQRLSSEDIVQETLLESARKIDTFEPRGPSSFYRWLVGIARFKLAEALRAAQAGKRALETGLDSAIPAEQTSLVGRVGRAERARRLREVLDSLPEDQARAVCLRYLEGLSIAEAAERLERSPAAVKALVSRGLLLLARKLLDEN